MNVNGLLKHKSARIVFVILSILLCVYSVRGFIDLIRQSHTRWIAQDIFAAVQEMEKSPPGIERGERFLKRVKAIDPGYAPAEVKQALQDYIIATQQGFDALKMGQDLRPSEAAMAEARNRLIACIRKYD